MTVTIAPGSLYLDNWSTTNRVQMAEKHTHAVHERVIRIQPERPRNRANRTRPTHRLSPLDLHKRRLMSL
jgi:hypothetical protein